MNLDEGDVGKLKSQYNFSYNLDEVYSSKPQEPVVINTKPAILIEKARTHEILIPGSAKESNDLACLVRFKIKENFMQYFF